MRDSSPPVRAASAQKTRDALVDAAMELFAEQGLTGPSLDAICARAGFTRGAFYVHFKTRDDLIVAVIDKVLGGFIDAIISAASGAEDAELATIVRAFTFAVGAGAFPFRGQVRPHQILEACVRSDKLHAKYLELLARARDRLQQAVLRGQSGGTVRADVDADAVAQLLLSTVLGVEVASELRVPYDATKVSENVLRMLAPVGS